MESFNAVDAEDLKAFLIESHEMLAQFERDVLSLENGALNPDQLDRLYRSLHTIKGNCGFLPFAKLEAIAHAGETLLGTIRTTQRNITPDVATALLQLADAIQQVLQTIEATASEGNQDYSGLIATLTTLCKTDAIPQATITHHATPLDAADGQSGMPLDSTIDSTIRVQVDLLDYVMNLVGELVLARNRLLQLTATNQDAEIVVTGRQIDLITNELQDNVMKARMQPISTLWRNLPRLVRDLALDCGKEVALELEGSETELDRSLIAAIKDPLTHLIRNCIDHGIESPDRRMAIGKSAQGRLKLRAFQENSKVILEISDDGAGIDSTQIKARSQQMGLITAAQATSMTDREALELIFLPGFSTTTEVTRLSGRGVGMDVVRRNLESVQGTVEIDSQLGHGTTFRLKIPLTLAIIPALLVSSSNERFAIPQANVQELIRLEGEDQIQRSIETLLNVPVYRLRGQILPLVNLAAVLQLPPSTGPTDLLYFVVIAADDYRFGLIVDWIEDTQNMVVKPLSKQLRSLNMFAGATVLGDGAAALILDTSGLAKYAGVQRQSQQSFAPATELEPGLSDRQLILIMLGPQNVRMGILLTHATRLEILPSTVIERVGDQYLMQYRDRIVSLIDLQAVCTGMVSSPAEFAEFVSIVIITLDGDRTVGLIVHQILDIVEEAITVTGAATRPGVTCYATVQGHITEMLDLNAIVELTNPYRTARELLIGARR